MTRLAALLIATLAIILFCAWLAAITPINGPL